MLEGPLIGIAISTLMPFVLQRIKGLGRFAFMRRNAPRLNRAVALLAAAATSLGISWHFQLLPDGGWAATIAGPSLTDMITFVALFALNAGVQQGVYRAAIDPQPKR